MAHISIYLYEFYVLTFAIYTHHSYNNVNKSCVDAELSYGRFYSHETCSFNSG